MQKKIYLAPEAEIELFTVSNVITDSNTPTGGIGDIDNPIDVPGDF